jgi:hypothetical protein
MPSLEMFFEPVHDPADTPITYSPEIRATETPAMGGASEITMIMDQKYVGRCPAGAQPR